MTLSRDSPLSDETGIETMSESTTSLKGPGIFDGLTAWFSQSVHQHYLEAWGEADGQKCALDKALYIFSEDAAAEDTQSIYHSRAYLADCIAIFHPAYITECLRVGNLKQVSIGKYFLPPEDVQKVIGPSDLFFWNGERSPPARVDTKQNPAPRMPASCAQPMPSTSRVPRRSRQSASQTLSRTPRRQSVTPPGSVKQAGRQRRSSKRFKLSVVGSSRQKTKHPSSADLPEAASTAEGNDLHEVRQEDNSLHTLDGYQSVESLEYYKGRLDDFVLGQNGCYVTHKVKAVYSG